MWTSPQHPLQHDDVRLAPLDQSSRATLLSHFPFTLQVSTRSDGPFRPPAAPRGRKSHDRTENHVLPQPPTPTASAAASALPPAQRRQWHGTKPPRAKRTTVASHQRSPANRSSNQTPSTAATYNHVQTITSVEATTAAASPPRERRREPPAGHETTPGIEVLDGPSRRTPVGQTVEPGDAQGTRSSWESPRLPRRLFGEDHHIRSAAGKRKGRSQQQKVGREWSDCGLIGHDASGVLRRSVRPWSIRRRLMQNLRRRGRRGIGTVAVPVAVSPAAARPGFGSFQEHDIPPQAEKPQQQGLSRLSSFAGPCTDIHPHRATARHDGYIAIKSSLRGRCSDRNRAEDSVAPIPGDYPVDDGPLVIPGDRLSQHVNEFRPFRPRTDDRHLPLDDVQQLRDLVEMEPPQYSVRRAVIRGSWAVCVQTGPVPDSAS